MPTNDMLVKIDVLTFRRGQIICAVGSAIGGGFVRFVKSRSAAIVIHTFKVRCCLDYKNDNIGSEKAT